MQGHFPHPRPYPRWRRGYLQVWVTGMAGQVGRKTCATGSYPKGNAGRRRERGAMLPDESIGSHNEEHIRRSEITRGGYIVLVPVSTYKCYLVSKGS